jgi:hypothetical protein
MNDILAFRYNLKMKFHLVVNTVGKSNSLCGHKKFLLNDSLKIYRIKALQNGDICRPCLRKLEKMNE